MRGVYFILSFVLVVLLFASCVAAEDWYQQESGTDEPLFAVWFANEREGWAVGGSIIPSTSTILHSSDGGVSWSAQVSPVSESLSDVCFADASHGWAVGSNVILHTTNGGETWVEQTTPFETSFNDVSCLPNSNTVYVVGAAGELDPSGRLYGSILKTTNGGDTWIALDSELEDSLAASFFIDEEHGYVLGSGGSILRTDDGETFENLGILYRYDIPVGLSEISCFSMDDCWITGSGEFVYHSSDGGENWGDPINTGFTVSSLNSIAAKDEEHIWFTGQSTLRHTDDGGENWLIDPTDITVGSLELLDVSFMRDVMFVGDVGWAVGDEGTILRTGEPTDCPEVENTCLANGQPYAILYDETTGCIEGYGCVLLGEPDTTVQIAPTCLEEYRNCIEEHWPRIDECDAWEFCEGIDEVVAQVKKEHVKDTFDSAGEYQYFQNFFDGEQVNVYLTDEDGTVNSFGLSLQDGSFTVVDAYEKATIKISLSQESVDAIKNAENRKKAALDAVANGDIVIEGVGFKKIKVLFFKGGMKISLPFMKD